MSGHWIVTAAVAAYCLLVAAVVWSVRTRPDDPPMWPDDEYQAIQAKAPAHPALRPHSECVDVWADGRRPCGRCEQILGVRS